MPASTCDLSSAKVEHIPFSAFNISDIMPCKITLIGAGSVVFAKTLIGDILQFPELMDVTICLMDIDAERLKVADVMMRRMASKLGVAAKIESTLNRQQAIRDAKYVISTIQVGGYQPSTVVDFEIPAKYGLKQTIADTLGIGGIFRGLRTIPVIIDIAKEIEQYAHPDCLFLNYTNPMAMNCWAVDRAVGIPHVGLCHSVFGTARMLASHVNLPFEDISYRVAGINHMAFFLDFKYRGQDATPLLFKALNDPNRDFEKVRYEIMRRTGYFVTESSEHQSEYTPYFIPHGESSLLQFDIPINEYIRRCDAIIATWKDTEAELIGETGEIKVAEQSHEYGSYIIHSRETNIRRTIYGNVPNNGLIDNLTHGCCVELPCLIDGNGLQPTKIGMLPSQLAAICMTNVNVQQLTVDAALTGKREHIYHAAMLDPNTSATLPLDKIWAMCDELIEAHQRDGYLGEFAPVIINTGRSQAGIEDRIIARANAKNIKLNQANSTFTLEITIENPSVNEESIILQLVPKHEAITVEKRHIETILSANSACTLELAGKIISPIEQSTEIALLSNDPRILAISAPLLARKQITGYDDNPAEFSMELSGFPCAKGSISRDGCYLRLQMQVQDSNPKLRLEKPWEGSSIELFFASEDRPGITQLIVVPDKEINGSIVDLNLNPVDGAKIELNSNKAGYEFTLLLPSAAARIDTKGSFFFDIFANLNALGDAHSGGRSSLSGKFDSHADMSFACLADV
ncbi:alpha-glucosidase/alpha-galactosidase [Cerasicoccus frondis]|uniref:alpha-glucosidase/alpha-galactosidase n=1 Tax=Cerasicoccus frondis TaxID=490090 RepID=UPI002852C489|nr:alpha-glucosidase/alpha-galactosidase [Cerasicoccus frondis]